MMEVNFTVVTGSTTVMEEVKFSVVTEVNFGDGRGHVLCGERGQLQCDGRGQLQKWTKSTSVVKEAN